MIIVDLLSTVHTLDMEYTLKPYVQQSERPMKVSVKPFNRKII